MSIYAQQQQQQQKAQVYFEQQQQKLNKWCENDAWEIKCKIDLGLLLLWLLFDVFAWDELHVCLFVCFVSLQHFVVVVALLCSIYIFITQEIAR